MSKLQYKKIIYLILVLVWMLTVFMFSSENGDKSKQTSMSVTKTIVKVLTYNQDLSEEQTEEIVAKFDLIIRKLAHYSIYALGGILILNYINTYSTNSKVKIIIAILLGVTYAISDELHQYFISDRSAQILDVCIDSLGVCTGVIFLCIIQNLKAIKLKLLKS